MPHLDCRPMDPPGTKDRRWKCIDCGKVAVGLDWVFSSECTGPRKPDDQRLLDAIEGKDDEI